MTKCNRVPSSLGLFKNCKNTFSSHSRFNTVWYSKPEQKYPMNYTFLDSVNYCFQNICSMSFNWGFYAFICFVFTNLHNFRITSTKKYKLPKEFFSKPKNCLPRKQLRFIFIYTCLHGGEIPSGLRSSDGALSLSGLSLCCIYFLQLRMYQHITCGQRPKRKTFFWIAL